MCLKALLLFLTLFINQEHMRSNVRTCLRNGLAVWEGTEMHSEQMLLAQDLVGSNKKWQPTLVLLPGKFHGLRSLVGYSPWGHKESDTTEWLHFTFKNAWRKKISSSFQALFLSNKFSGSASRHWQTLPSCCFPPPGLGSESGLPSWDQCHWTGNELILPPCAPRIVLTTPHGTKQQGSRRRRA